MCQIRTIFIITMKHDIIIPINTFAQYFEANDARKLTLLKQHLRSLEKQSLRKEGESNAVYGNTARAQIRSTILAGHDHSLTERKLKQVRALTPSEDDKWHIIDQKVNIAILERFRGMSIPSILVGNKLEKVLPKANNMPFYGIGIKIVPSLTFRINSSGQKQIGACMIHASKEHPFSTAESKIVAALLYSFLSNCVAEEDEVVNPDLCFCIDPYAGTTVISNKYFPADMKIIQKICSELPAIYDVAARSLAA